MSYADHAREVRNALTDPRRLCQRLGLLDGAKRQSSGVSIRCPVHGEKDPSCSVTLGPDGTIRVRCFACDFSGDALTLIAHVHGIGLRSHFREVLALGAELAGKLQLREEILAGQPMPERERVAAPPPRPESDYPPEAEVRALWAATCAPDADPDAWESLRGRGIDPESAFGCGGLRVIPPGLKTPPWARYRGQSWEDTGHRLLVPMYDHVGQLRSVRAWRITGGDSPKRLPPAGCRATGLVMANRQALAMLRGRYCPTRVVIVEGEPDYATASQQWPRDAVIGLVSGSWTPDFAERLPRRTGVVLGTHNDVAGDRYAEQVAQTLGGRPTWRLSA